MTHLLASDTALVNWDTGIALLGVAIALFALWQTHRSNAVAREANQLSAKALQMQEDEGEVRLIVKPQMLCLVCEGEDSRPRPVVTVINLSAFPVTVEKIFWKTADPSGRGYVWLKPTIARPFHSLPVRLDSRQAFTALGTPEFPRTVEELLSVTAVVACTACGESIEGMSPQWKDYAEKARAAGKVHWTETSMKSKG